MLLTVLRRPPKLTTDDLMQFQPSDAPAPTDRPMQTKNYNPEAPVVVANVCPQANLLLQPVLDQWFGDSHYSLTIDETSDAGDLIRSVTSGSGKWKKKLRCVSAVFDQRFAMGVPDCFPADHQMILFVDDPFRLMVADFQQKSRQTDFWYRGQRMEFSQRFPTIDSFFRRYPDWLYGRFPADLTLANLPQKLGFEYLFTGLLETFQKSVNQLAEILGQPQVQLAGTCQAVEPVGGAELLRANFYNQYPLLKSVYDFVVNHPYSSTLRAEDGAKKNPNVPTGLAGPHSGIVTTGKMALAGQANSRPK